MITLQFERGGLLGRAIQAATWSRWDHVGFVYGDRLLSALPGPGVCWRAALVAGVTAQRFTVDAPDAVLVAARWQLGKRYDWSAVIGIGLHRDWRTSDHWFCSELVAWAFEQAGKPLVRADELDRITPRDVAMSPYLTPI